MREAALADLDFKGSLVQRWRPIKQQQAPELGDFMFKLICVLVA
jgi:hypothetical protein